MMLLYLLVTHNTTYMQKSVQLYSRKELKKISSMLYLECQNRELVMDHNYLVKPLVIIMQHFPVAQNYEDHWEEQEQFVATLFNFTPTLLCLGSTSINMSEQMRHSTAIQGICTLLAGICCKPTFTCQPDTVPLSTAFILTVTDV